MKQLLQDLAKGGTSIVESPAPSVTPQSIIINSTRTLISSGTERMLVDFGKANIIDKARQQPDKVKMVLEKVKTDGLITTIDAVKTKLAQPLPLGYCNVGTIESVGAGVEGFKVGDRVVSNGAHADVVRVPKNLCAAIPDNVSDEEAAFTVVASIGLQGVRLAQPTLGESFVVIGVGLIGLLTVQLLRLHGCKVLAADFDSSKLSIAKQFGAEVCDLSNGEDLVSFGSAFSRGRGVDGVIITASTKSNDPVSQAARMSRKRGRIILVGVTGLELSRDEFYKKELVFQVSCSYGPGRYDINYEDKGNDYPFGFVRWTEQRNFEAILDMMSSGLLNVTPLITHRFDFDDAVNAYETLTEDKAALGILLNYSSDVVSRHSTSISFQDSPEYAPETPVLGFIGAGNYASRVLIPAFKKQGAEFESVLTSAGLNGVIHGEKAGFKKATTNASDIFKNNKINTIVVATRHNTHSDFVIKALSSGKNVFVEKPLAINIQDLSKIKELYNHLQRNKEKNNPLLMVGFNRRFSPLIQKMKLLLDGVNEPKSFIMTVNPGAIPIEHWTQSIEEGGGRIIGEACHFVDLMRYLSGSSIVSVQARKMGAAPAVSVTEDKAAIILGFEDGSFGTIHYLSNGSPSFPKERVEVFSGGKVLQLDNFIKLKGFGWKNFKSKKLWKQDKGQNDCVSAFLEAVKEGKEAPIPSDELFEVAEVVIQIADKLWSQ